MRHVPLAGHKYVPVDIEAVGYLAHGVVARVGFEQRVANLGSAAQDWNVTARDCSALEAPPIYTVLIRMCGYVG